MFDRVFQFNREIVGIGSRQLKAFSEPEKKWMVGVLREEAAELESSEDLVDQVDALVDSIIFAVGGLSRLGLTSVEAYQCFSAVMAANFEKKAGSKAGRVVEGVADAVKPTGWVGPEERIKSILARGPYEQD